MSFLGPSLPANVFSLPLYSIPLVLYLLLPWVIYLRLLSHIDPIPKTLNPADFLSSELQVRHSHAPTSSPTTATSCSPNIEALPFVLPASRTPQPFGMYMCSALSPSQLITRVPHVGDLACLEPSAIFYHALSSLPPLLHRILRCTLQTSSALSGSPKPREQRNHDAQNLPGEEAEEVAYPSQHGKHDRRAQPAWDYQAGTYPTDVLSVKETVSH